MKLLSKPKGFLLTHFAIFLMAAAVLASFGYFTDNPERAIYEKIEGNVDWLKVNDDVNLSINDVVFTYKNQLGLGDKDALIHMRDDVDGEGNIHARFQHYYRGIQVEGSQLLVHLDSNERVYLVNGTLIRGLDSQYSINISKSEALEKAINLVPAEMYMWESSTAEKLIKKIRQDQSATLFPEAEIKWVHPSYSRNTNAYRAAYEITVHSMVPEKRQQFFIDVETGEVMLQLDLLHTGSSHGVAETKYHGTRNIITDSISVDSFRLIDTVRSAGIYTFNAKTNTNLDNAVHFHDSDNYWNNFNAERDEVAGDVHYGAEMTYDYYALLGQDGLNGDSISFISYVHVNTNWTNATWNGMFARFGDASSPDKPLASLDVVAHEFTHGLTDFTADLVYMDEPGALNESFSDIFGTAVEFFGDPETGDYLIGEDFIADGGFRSMSNPNDFGDPDTYFGTSWQNGGGDNGGVHTNSGVQNFWFYLLAEGASGTNDIGEDFDVIGLGINEAAKVAYGNLKNYLMVTSQYSDARLGAIQAAIDVYGDCSNEVIQTTNAWHAVGVGNVFGRTDFEVLSIVGPAIETCGVSDQELVAAQVVYNECDVTLPAGTIVPMMYSIDQGDAIMQDFVLVEDLIPGDTLLFTFDQPIQEFINPGVYDLTVSVLYPDDNSDYNNTIRVPYERIYAQNTDLALNTIVAPFSRCYMAVDSVILRLAFKGCDSIAAGEKITVGYRVDGAEWIDQDYVLEDDLFRDEMIDVKLDESYDFTEMKEYIVDGRVVYSADTILYNNIEADKLVDNPDPLQYEVLMTFEGIIDEVVDSFYTVNQGKVSITVEDSVGFLSTKGIKFTGGDIISDIENGKAVLPENENVWDVNPEYKGQVCFCADLSNTDKARLKFRFTQTYSPIYEDLYSLDVNSATALRLLLNGEQFQNDYNPLNNEVNPYFVRNLDISDYIGGLLEICFEASTLISAEFDPYEIGDNVHLDEVILIAEEVVSIEDAEWLDIQITPNPSIDQIFLDFPTEIEMESDLQILDIQGKVIQTIRLSSLDDSNIIDVSTLNNGIYFIHGVANKQVFAKKFVKI